MEDRVNTKEEDGRTQGFLSMMIYRTKDKVTNKHFHRRKKAKSKKQKKNKGKKIGVKCKLSGRNTKQVMLYGVGIVGTRWNCRIQIEGLGSCCPSMTCYNPLKRQIGYNCPREKGGRGLIRGDRRAVGEN